MELRLALLLLAIVCGGSGSVQHCCLQGPPGQAGTPGTPGTPGTAGTPGAPGIPGCAESPRRWKQCAWTYGVSRDDKDNGLVHECNFVKLRDDSYLRVVYMGNLRIRGCSNCCKRWYFTFNSTECQNPAAIDGAVYQSIDLNDDLNMHRPANIEGYCGAMPAGEVQVGFNVGNCGGGYSAGDAYTSWNQANRIIIEEVDPPVN